MPFCVSLCVSVYTLSYVCVCVFVCVCVCVCVFAYRVCTQDGERLCWDAEGIQTFWAHLETQRLLLESEAMTERASTANRRDRRGHPNKALCLSIHHVQMDLRDLLKKVNTQVLIRLVDLEIQSHWHAYVPCLSQNYICEPMVTSTAYSLVGHQT